MGATLTIDPSILDDLDMVEYLYDLQHAADSDERGLRDRAVPAASCAATTTQNDEEGAAATTTDASPSRRSANSSSSSSKHSTQTPDARGNDGGRADALRADLQRFYGLDMDEIGHTVRVRRAADLAANLPEDALTWGRIDERATWGTRQTPARHHRRQHRLHRMDEDQSRQTRRMARRDRTPRLPQDRQRPEARPRQHAAHPAHATNLTEGSAHGRTSTRLRADRPIHERRRPSHTGRLRLSRRQRRRTGRQELHLRFSAKIGAVAGVTASVFNKVAGVVASSLNSAIGRADQMNKLPQGHEKPRVLQRGRGGEHQEDQRRRLDGRPPQLGHDRHGASSSPH